MIAAVCSWHEHHERAIRALQERFDQKQRMIVAAPALIEAYSVLTRLPASHRIEPQNALTLLDTNFVGRAKIVALGAAGYRTLLRGAPDAGVSGGRIYDAVIATCARNAKVQTLLTFNEAHFASFATASLAIAVP